MSDTKKNILIIGAGIHGCFLAKHLAKYNLNVTILEKNKDICAGASNATHNRANRGFHYPRSNSTTSECKYGYRFFENNYKRFLKKTSSYYCIEKKSKINFKRYINFFRKNKLKFKIIKKTNLIKNKRLEGIVLGEEGCYDHLKLKNYLKNKIKSKKIKKYFNFNLEKVFFSKSLLKLTSSNNNKVKVIEGKFDVIVNATYDNSNVVIKKFGVKKVPTKYIHQLTEVVRVKSNKNFPGITVMDGPFATLMPYVGKKNEYLLYDVTNSILKTSTRPIQIKNPKSNYKKIFKKLSKYLNHTDQFVYKSSFFGNRPVPILDKFADRSTKIIKNKLKNKSLLISIQEGKYISAPFITNKLSMEIIKYVKKK